MQDWILTLDLQSTCFVEQDQPKKKAKKQKKAKQKTKGGDEKVVNVTEDEVTHIDPLKQEVSHTNNAYHISVLSIFACSFD